MMAANPDRYLARDRRRRGWDGTSGVRPRVAGATTAGAGAPSSSRAVLSTRWRRMAAPGGREAHGRRCSARPRMRYTSSRARTPRRATGLRQTSRGD